MTLYLSNELRVVKEPLRIINATVQPVTHGPSNHLFTCKHEVGIKLIGDKLSVIGGHLILEVLVSWENGSIA